MNNLQKIVCLHNAHGGVTFSIQTGRALGVEPVFVVAVLPSRSLRTPGARIDEGLVRGFWESNRHLLENVPGYHIGTWFDADAGWTDLDIVSATRSLEEAKRLGKQHGQKAIWDADRQTVIPLT